MTNDELRISVIVPTLNRSEMLRNCVESLLNQTLDPHLYEIIIVDNNSEDATREVARSYLMLPTHNVRYTLEPRKGLHFARHAGAKAAHSEILAFTDDDAICDECWIEALLTAFGDETTGCAGGRIIIQWDRKPPQWVIAYEDVLGRLDYGPKPRILENNELVNGGNLAIRKRILKDLGGFNPDQVGEVLVGDGEVGLCNKVHSAGIKMVWVPDAIVWHCQTVSKNATLLDLKRRFSNNGIADAYGFYKEMYPTKLQLLSAATVSMYHAIRFELIDIASRLIQATVGHDYELRTVYFRAKASYELKLAFKKDIRAHANKQDWCD